MVQGLIIRPYRAGDAIAVAMVYHRAIHHGTAPHYSAAQANAWSPSPPTGPGWRARVEERETLVAERAGQVLGFFTLDIDDGYLDFAFVAPEAKGQGIGTALYSVIEGRARVAGRVRLETQASLVAQPFFKRHGWRIVRRQEVERAGILLPNAVMEKHLTEKARAG